MSTFCEPDRKKSRRHRVRRKTAKTLPGIRGSFTPRHSKKLTQAERWRWAGRPQLSPEMLSRPADAGRTDHGEAPWAARRPRYDGRTEAGRAATGDIG